MTQFILLCGTGDMKIMLLNHTSKMARPQVDQARLREGLIYVLLAMLAVLIAVGGWLTYRFAMPVETPWVTVGSLERFPPRAEPYWFSNNEASFYLVNDGEALFAVHPQTHVSGRTACYVVWDEAIHGLMDPCWGTGFSAYGDYIFHGPPPDRGLDRFPVQVTEAGEIQVRLDSVITARTPAEVEQFCRQTGRRLASAPFPGEMIFDECDFHALAYSE
jgi:hypothetical protein